jgi:hypothetical protein
MADFTRNGYGQVEANQLSAQKTGQIYASLPLDPAVNVLQNGEFMFYDYQSGKVSADDSTGVAEPMLVFNEIKLYEPFWRRSYKDFAMIRVGDNYVTSKLAVNGPIEGRYDDGALTVGVAANPAHPDYPYRMDGIAPRLFKTNIGDIYTTNMVKTGVEYVVGNLLVPVKDNTSKTLVLEKFSGAQPTDKPTGMAWVVVKEYTMPDGQPGLKLQRVQ